MVRLCFIVFVHLRPYIPQFNFLNFGVELFIQDERIIASGKTYHNSTLFGRLLEYYRYPVYQDLQANSRTRTTDFNSWKLLCSFYFCPKIFFTHAIVSDVIAHKRVIRSTFF